MCDSAVENDFNARFSTQIMLRYSPMALSSLGRSECPTRSWKLDKGLVQKKMNASPSPLLCVSHSPTVHKSDSLSETENVICCPLMCCIHYPPVHCLSHWQRKKLAESARPKSQPAPRSAVVQSALLD